jgi:hypothetical protein
VAPDVSQSTSDALVRVMAKNPADRFLSYDEFQIAFEAARTHLLIQQQTQGPQGGKGGKSKTSWWRR